MVCIGASPSQFYNVSNQKAAQMRQEKDNRRLCARTNGDFSRTAHGTVETSSYTYSHVLGPNSHLNNVPYRLANGRS